MTDVVTRLRQWTNYPTFHNGAELMREAIDQIEAYESALQRLAEGEIPASKVEDFAKRVLGQK
jgi:hypothetical protein